MTREMSDWLVWLDRFKPAGIIDFNLSRISEVGKKLELLKPAPLVITVGGTNGKGSVVALLESIFLAAGFSVGSFTSPYLLCINEQFRINGIAVSDNLLCQGFSVISQGCKDVPLTYFEFLTCVAAYCFLYTRLDIVINEVGLGGRLDATNIFSSDISVITSIGYDHQEWLGSSLEKIAYEKSCIMRCGKPSVYGGDVLTETIESFARQIGAILTCKNKEFMLSQIAKDSWDWIGLKSNFQPIQLEKLPKTKLLLTNAATALQVLQFIPRSISRHAIEEGLRQAELPGRYHKIKVKTSRGDVINLVVDVAHNPQAAEVLKERLVEDYSGLTVWMILAMCSDKDFSQFIQVLLPCVTHWVCTETQSERALCSKNLEQVLYDRNYFCLRYNNVAQALQNLLVEKVSDEDVVIVTGSFKVVAEALDFTKSAYSVQNGFIGNCFDE